MVEESDEIQSTNCLLWNCTQCQDGNGGSVKTFRGLPIKVSTTVVNENENRLLKSGKDRELR